MKRKIKNTTMISGIVLLFLIGISTSFIIGSSRSHKVIINPSSNSTYIVVSNNVVIPSNVVPSTNVVICYSNNILSDSDMIEIMDTGAIPNFDRVTNNIYRGSQPTEVGWRYLHNVLGVTNVVKLNTEKEGSDEYAISLGMKVNYFPISFEEQMMGPSSQKINSILASITDKTFIHCGSDLRTKSGIDKTLDRQGGQDRTGLVVAEYRYLVDGWSKQDARQEMLQHGFHTSLVGLDWYWREKTIRQ